MKASAMGSFLTVRKERGTKKSYGKRENDQYYDRRTSA
mgnify:CR=1 FL=1